jgi:hypothetical protein
MELNKNQLSFLLEAISLSSSELICERYCEEKSEPIEEWISMEGNGKYKLTGNEIDELALLISENLK